MDEVLARRVKSCVVTAVCLLFLLKLKWPKNKNIYEIFYVAGLLAIIGHFNEICIKCGQNWSNDGKISKEDVKVYYKVTSCGKIYLKEHDFFRKYTS